MNTLFEKAGLTKRMAWKALISGALGGGAVMLVTGSSGAEVILPGALAGSLIWLFLYFSGNAE